MFEIDKKNLILRNKLTKNNQELITINITFSIINTIYYHSIK